MSNTVKQLGFIPTNRGEFDTTGQTRYYKDNVVQYRNGSYICSPVGYSSSNPTAYTTDAPYQDGDTELNANWKLMASVGLVDNEPIADSENLVKSGGVEKYIPDNFESVTYSNTEVELGYAMKIQDGIEVKVAQNNYIVTPVIHLIKGTIIKFMGYAPTSVVAISKIVEENNSISYIPLVLGTGVVGDTYKYTTNEDIDVIACCSSGNKTFNFYRYERAVSLSKFDNFVQTTNNEIGQVDKKCDDLKDVTCKSYLADVSWTIASGNDGKYVKSNSDVTGSPAYGIVEISLDNGDILYVKANAGINVAILSEKVGNGFIPIKMAERDGVTEYIYIASRLCTLALSARIGSDGGSPTNLEIKKGNANFIGYNEGSNMNTAFENAGNTQATLFASAFEDISVSVEETGKYINLSGVKTTTTNLDNGVSSALILQKYDVLKFTISANGNLAFLSRVVDGVYTPLVTDNTFLQGETKTFYYISDCEQTVIFSGLIANDARKAFRVKKTSINTGLVDALQSGGTPIPSTLDKWKLSPYTSVNRIDMDGGTITGDAVAQRYMFYLPVVAGDTYKVSLILNNTSPSNQKPVKYGIYSSTPAVGSTTSAYGDFNGDNDTIVEEEISINSNGYLAVFMHVSYHKSLSIFKKVSTSTIDVIKESVKRQYDLNKNYYDGKILNIEYSQFSPDATTPAGNTEEHFRKAIAVGFNALKADMRITSDGEIVLCHDAGYTFDGNGRITTFNSANNTPIANLTLTDVLALEFATQYEGRYLHPCTLDTMLFLCKKYNVVPYLTIRDDEYAVQTVERCYELLCKYNLLSKVVINNYPDFSNGIALFKDKYDGIVICSTRETHEGLTKNKIDMAYKQGVSYICLYYGVADTITESLAKYAGSKNIGVMVHSVDTSEEYDECARYGVCGFQITTQNKIWE